MSGPACCEYLVVELDPNRVHWFVRRRPAHSRPQPAPTASFAPEVFPGSGSIPPALYAEDLDRSSEVLDQGLATPDTRSSSSGLARAERIGGPDEHRRAASSPILRRWWRASGSTSPRSTTL